MYIAYMIVRDVAARLAKSKKSVLLLGPRQVGKSTLARSLRPDLAVNLADEALFLSHSKDPGRFRREVAALRKPSLVLLDEVQRVPALLNTVQALVDEGLGHRFLLTGSSARKLKRGGANLLPGRIVLEHLDPLSVRELGTAFELERALRVGTLPGVYLDEAEGEDVLAAYAAVYLREEVQAEGLSKNLGAYARFLDVAAACSGQWINYSKLSSDAEIPKETVRRFYSILEETLLAVRVPPFRPRGSSRRVSHRDRFILFDVGVRNALLGVHRQTLSPVETGMLFEQWVILQCLYLMRAGKKPWTMSSYRTDAGAEVDLVLDTGPRLLAVECKYGTNVSEADLGGLRSLESIAHKPIDKFVVYRGTTRQRFSRGETAVPFLEFLEETFG
jgi:predicted AAA+ superfamily ATPase